MLIINLIKGFLAGLSFTRPNQCHHLSLELVKIEAARYYLHGVRLARLLVIGLLEIGLVLGLIGGGLLLFHAGLFILLPWTLEAKSVLAIFLGLAYVALGCVALRIFLAQKTWMKKSGVIALLETAQVQRNKD